MKSSLETQIENHYRSPEVLEQLLQRLDDAAVTGETPAVDALGAVDEFHTAGARATEFALGLLPLVREMNVLDAGCGIGGTARRIAAHAGCRVTGIDLTDDFTQTATALTDRMKLSHLCQFLTGSVLRMPFADNTFEVTVSFHVAMNIEARRDFYNEVRRVTRPGGWFLSYDLVRGSNPEELTFPTPWSSSPEGSFLLTAAETQATLAECGFAEIQQHRLPPGPKPDSGNPPPNNQAKPPSLLLGADAAQKVNNHKAAISDQRMEPLFFLAHR